MNYERIYEWLIAAGVPAAVATVVAALLVAGTLLLGGCAGGDLVVHGPLAVPRPSVSSFSNPASPPSPAAPQPPATGS